MAKQFDNDYFNEDDLREMGIGSVGRNVKIAKNCVVIGLPKIHIANNVRIDGFCTLIATGEGWIKLGSHIHIGGYTHISGGRGVTMEDFSGLSQSVRIYSITDDYSGEFMTNPTVPAKYTGATGGPVTIGRHSIVGSNSVILPDLTLAEGVSVGAMSLVTKSLDAWGVYFGSPVKRLKERKKDLLELEAKFLAEQGTAPNAH